jgi:hypothetical protein
MRGIKVSGLVSEVRGEGNSRPSVRPVEKGKSKHETGGFVRHSSRPFSIFHFLLPIFLLLPAVLAAQNVRSTIDSTELLIGDQFHLDLWADIPSGSSVAWPQLKDTLTKQVEIVDASVLDTVRKENGDYTVHQRLTLTCFDTGFILVPPLAFVVDNDSSRTLLTDPELILVSEFEVDMEQDIMDIKGPMDVPINWRKYVLYGLIALVVIGLLIAGFLYWKKHRKPKEAPLARPLPTRPAHEIALEKLEELRLKKLWQNDRTKEYYIELSDIVREYIEFRFGIMALEQTTDETLRSLQISGVDTEQLRTLKGMLQLADLAKFAKYRPLADENDRSMDVAKAFVKGTVPSVQNETGNDKAVK